MEQVKRKYGYIPDLMDYRDIKYAAVRPMLIELPRKVDLRPGCPEVYDQHQLGSCTANAIGAAHQFNQGKQLGDISKTFVPSRLFIYFNERAMEGTIDIDAGAMIRDGIKSVVDKGVCLETHWPYDESKFRDQPPLDCYAAAEKHQALTYQRLNSNLIEIKNCLAEGYPFVFGFSVYENFESAEVARTGVMPMPAGKQLGGHAVTGVGYDDDKQAVLVRNSWGSGWGQDGYFWMPYEYITNSDLCDDFWTIRSVEV